MRIIAQNILSAFATKHPETKPSLDFWSKITRASHWSTTSDVQLSFTKAKVLNAERVRFEIAGGNYRMVVAFKFCSEIAFVKFLGTHAEYDRIDALTINLF